MIQKCWYIFLSCAPTPRKRFCCVSSRTDGCGKHSIIPWRSGKCGLAFILLTHLHLSGVAQVSAAAAAILSFAPHEGGLYSGGGVWMWVGQGVVLPSAGEGVERVERAESTDSAWDHGNGVGGHERDVIWWAPHSESVVWRAGSPQYHVVGVQGVAPAVAVQVRVLLHLQGHDLLLLSVS